jgi:PST family polysaccharide transporter
MVTAITGVLGLFKEFGLSTATVQRAAVSDEQISTLFWINLVVGAVLCLASLAIAPFVAAFYHEPRLFAVMTVLAFGFLFNAAGVQHSALLQRQMRFIASATIEILSLVISSGVSVAMALRGYGYWALVAWSVTLPLVSTLLTWIQVGWIPGRPRVFTGIRSMMRFGGTVTLNSVVVYVAYNLDKVLLGRFWGAEAIGLYGRAYQLVSLPTENLNAAAGGVAFPVLARLQGDPQRLRSCFLKTYSLVLALTVPVTLACALFADDLILVLLGSKWNDAVPLFRLLAPTILTFALINPPGWLLLALGMVGRSLRIALAIAPLAITGYVIGLPYGPKGVALGYSVAMMLWVVPHLLWAFHGTVVSFRDAALVVSRPLVSGMVGASLAFGVLFVAGPALSPVARLLLGGSVLVGGYALVLLFALGQKALYLDVIRGLRPSSSAGSSENKIR